MKSCYTIKLSPTKIAIADLCDYYGEGLIITRINVPSEFRGQKFGSKLLDMICAEADKENITLFLEISAPVPFRDTLETWYRSRGFKGQHVFKRKPQKG